MISDKNYGPFFVINFISGLQPTFPFEDDKRPTNIYTNAREKDKDIFANLLEFILQSIKSVSFQPREG